MAIKSYLCSIEDPWKYAGRATTTVSLSSGKEPTVELFGRRLPAETAFVRRCFAEEGTPPERQIDLWWDLWRQWPDALWGEVCMAEVDRLETLLRREAETRRDVAAQGLYMSNPKLPVKMEQPKPDNSLNSSNSYSENNHAVAAVDTHFVWLGDRHGVLVDHLRDGIAALAAAGLIAADRQEALRRALGLCVNDVERRTPVEPVVWLGPVDMLWLLVDELWALDLITCAGGRQQKWRTACAVFLRPDGRRFGLTLKNSRCTNAAKRDLMERALLGGLRRLVAGR
ncbi:MAG: hypothetical protein II484_02920 [Bacteroidaceae bacterium]|nr:hypothetical protein [Bacteroidaceae bacterium]